ncbi:MAG: helix-turn-helix domain-containing protein [Clostridia bacterium]|nr:helix-turn-helix domain-containing protein [Clostridia bacterium]
MDRLQIKRIRLTAHLMQFELAKILGVSTCTVSAWETGRKKISIPNQRKLIEFCHKYEIEI